jgi:geranylgeranyl transferase type-2 subunit beta
LGAAQLDPAVRDRHAQWLRQQQSADGGFAGREGESDPYYTAFALRGLWVLGELDPGTGAAAASFLRGRLHRRESIIDLISLIFAAAICEMAVGEVVIPDDDPTWREKVASLLDGLRTSDGGFAKTPEGRAGSTYQTPVPADTWRFGPPSDRESTQPLPQSERSGPSVASSRMFIARRSSF